MADARLASEIVEHVDPMIPDDFLKNPRSWLANPEERGVLIARRSDEGYRVAPIGHFTKPSIIGAVAAQR